MLSIEEQIRQELWSLAEEPYREFSARLIPGCENMMGVRIPAIRKIAKRLAKQGAMEYLNGTEERYFEEIMLKGLIIGNLKGDVETLLKQAAGFIPRITNWSICDSFCAEWKLAKKYPEQVWDFLQPYWRSGETYSIRFAVVMMLRYYVDAEHQKALFEIFDQIHHPDHYVKMAVAWAISVCYPAFPRETMEYLRSNNLDDDTYHKALQKIRESLKVDDKAKEEVRKMKRHKGR